MLNKPIYVRFTVLELSKYLMYDFHYNFITENLMLTYCLLIQTVLLMYEMKSKDVYEELLKYKHLFDFSEYKSNFFDSTNKKLIGKIKDEFKGIPINKFIG